MGAAVSCSGSYHKPNRPYCVRKTVFSIARHLTAKDLERTTKPFLGVLCSRHIDRLKTTLKDGHRNYLPSQQPLDLDLLEDLQLLFLCLKASIQEIHNKKLSSDLRRTVEHEVSLENRVNTLLKENLEAEIADLISRLNQFLSEK